ncbi:hypothetical protein PIB30_108126, partial [Stylosanthes scabra]|nr:hypothetical protein [Stylosanthes scabra]
MKKQRLEDNLKKKKSKQNSPRRRSCHVWRAKRDFTKCHQSFPNLRPSHVWTWLAQVPNMTNPKYKEAKLSFMTSLVCLPSFK